MIFMKEVESINFNFLWIARKTQITLGLTLFYKSALYLLHFTEEIYH